MNISLTNDILFKAVFGIQKNSYILADLLNSILDLKGSNALKKINILNPFVYQDYLTDKLVILDIKAEDELKNIYDIEMQIGTPIGFISRAYFYNAKLIASQLIEGSNYVDLPKAICIFIISNGILFPNYKEIHNTFSFRHDKNFNKLIDLNELHFIELDKFIHPNPVDLKNKFDLWMHTVKYSESYKEIDEENIPKVLKKETEIIMAIKEYRKKSSNSKYRAIMEAREKGEMAQKFAIGAARKEGLIVGKTEGKAEGKAEGERLANIKATKNMLEKGFSLEQCSEILDLPLEKVKEYANL